MKNLNFILPKLVNEDVKDYKKGSPERKEVQDEYDKMYNENIDIHALAVDDEPDFIDKPDMLWTLEQFEKDNF